MSKKFLSSIIAIALLASPALAKPSFSSGGGFHSSFSSSSSSRFSSGGSYSGTSNTSKFSSGASYSSKPVVGSPKFSSGNTYNSTPITAPRATTSVYSGSRSIIVQHNVYGGYNGGYGYNHNGGIFNNPWFWMWAMNNHNNAPVYVNNGGGSTAQYAPQQGPTFFGILFGIIAFIIQLAFLVAIGFGIWWLLRKFIFKKKTTPRFDLNRYR